MEKNDLTTKITRLSLSRKVTVLVLFLTILAIGFISTNRLPLEMEPKGSEGHGIYVRTAWRSGVPMESMEKIGIPMEEELSTVRGLDSMSTRCSTSSASVDLRFKQGTDMAVAYREVRDRMERARLRFPEGTEKPRIYKRDSDPESIVRMTIGSQKHVPDYDLINKNVISPLLRIDGVADVEFHIEKKEIMIEIDKERAESLEPPGGRMGRCPRTGWTALSTSGRTRSAGRTSQCGGCFCASSMARMPKDHTSAALEYPSCAEVRGACGERQHGWGCPACTTARCRFRGWPAGRPRG